MTTRLNSRIQSAQLQNKNVDRYALIKSSVKDQLLVTTFHAIPNILRTRHNLVKILWLVCFAVSTSMAVYFTIKSIFEYLNFQIVTLYEIKQEKSTLFPTVSICSQYGFNTTSLDILIAKCFFNGNPECDLKKKLYFEFYDDIAYKKCLRFNGQLTQDRKINWSGYRFGFYVEINRTYFNELIIYIHNKSSSPVTLLNRETYIGPLTYSEFTVSKIYTKNLPKPFNDCYKDLNDFEFNKTFINMILNENRTYTQKECFDLCSFDYFVRNNNCSCSATINDVLLKCFWKADLITQMCFFEFINSYVINHMNDLCLKYCPLECDSFVYSIEKFSSFSANYTGIAVYFEELKYTLITQEPKTPIFDLVANVGGILGLFIGVSFLSFVELIEIFLEVILIQLCPH